ncbi:MAG TPA: T9SS type A sorting domain-containing protein [Bacteroidia bacterium]|nr:T9SS type A sorting domain-containing protein [Bacteroidia bacterium]
MKNILLLSLLSIINFNVCKAAGGWQKIYPTINGSADGDGINALCQTADGGFIFAGLIKNNSAASENRVTKVDDLGNIQWSFTYFGNLNNNSWATNIELAPNGGYYVEGRNRNPINYQDEVYIQHIDANGNQIWVNFYPQANISTKGAVTSDGGYVSISYDYDNVNLIDSVVLIKVDANGVLNFMTKHAATQVGIVHSVLQTMNGEYVVEGYYNSQTFLSKFDANGNFLWRQFYGLQSAHPEYIGKVVENADGTYTVAGNDALTWGAHDVYLFKTDANGALLWEQHYGQTLAMSSDMDKTSDGGYIITGFKNYNTSPKIILIKTNGLGAVQWVKEYNGDGSGSWKAYSVRQTNDGGYAVGGARVSSFYERENMYLIKTDELGEIYSNTLQGYVYDDTNNDCISDTGEYRMANRIIEITGNQTFWTSTNSDGYYWVRVDTGNYQMILHPSTNTAYWQVTSCNNDTIQLNIPTQNTTIETSFAHNAIAYCPLLNVELSTPFLRRCFDNNYYVHYCNTGTAIANNAYIDVEFDSYLTLDTNNISVSWVSLGSNIYRLNIGNVGIGACGTIPLSLYVSCNAVLNQTHCSNAQIFPTSNCLSPTWYGAIISVDANCMNDSIIFTLSNTGFNNSNFLTLQIMQDTLQVGSNIFSLNAGQSSQIIIPNPNGATYTLIAQQEIGYPAQLGDSLVSVSIEGCGGAINTGIVTQFGSYDGSPFLDIDCRMNIGAYDPNDKQGFPAGYSINHYITPTTVLDYQIRFQNTGTDTAFNIVVRDTIPQSLDIATITPGASSHNYTYVVHGENAQVIDFIFNNIQLPDSNVNEPASNGFVKFKINQKANNPIGTVIENKAGIYFDFNEAVITNSTHHVIGQNFIESNLVGLSTQAPQNEISVNVFPNPAKDDVIFEIKNSQHSNYALQIFNLHGSSVLQQNFSNSIIKIQKGSLPAGIYFYQVNHDKGIAHIGKLIIN